MSTRRPDRWAQGLAGLLAVTGVLHFVAPDGFDKIVPHVLPGSPRFWTITSGLAELVLAGAVAWPRTRRVGATVTAGFFVVVFPANVQMAADWSSRSGPEFALALARLPLQIPLIWWAWSVRRRTPTETDR